MSPSASSTASSNISTSHAVEAGPASFDPFFTDPFSPGFGDRRSQAMSKGSGVIVTRERPDPDQRARRQGADDIKVTLHDGNDYRPR